MALHPLTGRAPATWLAPLAAALLAGCDRAPEPGAAASEVPVTVSGRYSVRGVTIDPSSPDKRRISGTVILVQDGDRYTATYELETTWPAEGGFTDAQVIGVGEGAVEGNTLTGTARTQLVIASVPGIDSGFAFVPRVVTARLESASVARIAPDGKIEISLANHGVAGEDYRPTRTRVAGRRVHDAPERVAEAPTAR